MTSSGSDMIFNGYGGGAHRDTFRKDSMTSEDAEKRMKLMANRDSTAIKEMSKVSIK